MIGNQVLDWLVENKKWIKVSAICKSVGIDDGNFSRYVKSRSLPEKYVDPIVKIISRFGFSGTTSANKSAVIVPKEAVLAKKAPTDIQVPSDSQNIDEKVGKVPFEKEKWFFIEKYTLMPLSSKPLITALIPKWKADKIKSDTEIKKAWEKFQNEG